MAALLNWLAGPGARTGLWPTSHLELHTPTIVSEVGKYLEMTPAMRKRLTWSDAPLDFTDTTGQPYALRNVVIKDKDALPDGPFLAHAFPQLECARTPFDPAVLKALAPVEDRLQTVQWYHLDCHADSEDESPLGPAKAPETPFLRLASNAVIHNKQRLAGSKGLQWVSGGTLASAAFECPMDLDPRALMSAELLFVLDETLSAAIVALSTAGGLDLSRCTALHLVYLSGAGADVVRLANACLLQAATTVHTLHLAIGKHDFCWSIVAGVSPSVRVAVLEMEGRSLPDQTHGTLGRLLQLPHIRTIRVGCYRDALPAVFEVVKAAREWSGVVVCAMADRPYYASYWEVPPDLDWQCGPGHNIQLTEVALMAFRRKEKAFLAGAGAPHWARSVDLLSLFFPTHRNFRSVAASLASFFPSASHIRIEGRPRSFVNVRALCDLCVALGPRLLSIFGEDGEGERVAHFLKLDDRVRAACPWIEHYRYRDSRVPPRFFSRLWSLAWEAVRRGPQRRKRPCHRKREPMTR